MLATSVAPCLHRALRAGNRRGPRPTRPAGVNALPRPRASVQISAWADDRVVLGLDPVAGVARAERLDLRDEPVEVVQALHGGREHDEQLALLVAHVLREHDAQRGRNLEQAGIEEIGGETGDRNDLIESLDDEREVFLGRCGIRGNHSRPHGCVV